ncbi:hypothetical protein D3C76_1214310 [compost metagenome]
MAYAAREQAIYRPYAGGHRLAHRTTLVVGWRCSIYRTVATIKCIAGGQTFDYPPLRVDHATKHGSAAMQAEQRTRRYNQRLTGQPSRITQQAEQYRIGAEANHLGSGAHRSVTPVASHLAHFADNHIVQRRFKQWTIQTQRVGSTALQRCLAHWRLHKAHS